MSIIIYLYVRVYRYTIYVYIVHMHMYIQLKHTYITLPFTKVPPLKIVQHFLQILQLGS